MKISKNVDNYFKRNCLHDYTLCDIKVDYYNRLIIVEILDETNAFIKKDIVKLCFKEFISFKIDNAKPFGGGLYILTNYIEINDAEKKYIIQLNSGDVCEIVCKIDK